MGCCQYTEARIKDIKIHSDENFNLKGYWVIGGKYYYVKKQKYLLGKIELYNFEFFENGFFLWENPQIFYAEEVVFHVGYAYDRRIVFPICKYHCQKIVLSFNLDDYKHKRCVEWTIENFNCPVDIEIKICSLLPEREGFFFVFHIRTLRTVFVNCLTDGVNVFFYRL